MSLTDITGHLQFATNAPVGSFEMKTAAQMHQIRDEPLVTRDMNFNQQVEQQKADMRASMEMAALGVVGEGEKIVIDAPFKLARACLASGEWLLKIELLDPVLLSWFREIIKRGANTFDMHEMDTLRSLIDGILESPASDVAPALVPVETHEEKHFRIFSAYVDFQEQKEKMLPVREQKFHMMLGLSGELLELMQGFEIKDAAKSRANILEELGDMLFFLHGLRRHYCPTHRRTSAKFADSSQRFVEPGVPMMLVNAVVNLIDMVKKDLISEKPFRAEAYHDSIEVVELMMSKLCKTLGIQMYDLAESNMDKLNKRYKDKFTAAEAVARADKADDGPF